MQTILTTANEAETRQLGARIGELLRGGDVLELIGDVGAGKTTFTKGIAKGLGIHEEVQSPSFTISRVYDARDDLQLVHYDFYRLLEAGVMADAVAETIGDSSVITVVEWGDIVAEILPDSRITIRLISPNEFQRRFVIQANDTFIGALS